MNEQGTPACEMLTVWPATLIAPVRGPVLALGATEKDRVPVPESLPVTRIQETVLLAVQEHAPSALMLRVPDPPEGPKEFALTDRLYEQARVAAQTALLGEEVLPE